MYVGLGTSFASKPVLDLDNGKEDTSTSDIKSAGTGNFLLCFAGTDWLGTERCLVLMLMLITARA